MCCLPAPSFSPFPMCLFCLTGLATSALLLAGCASHRNLPVYGSVPDFTLTDQKGDNFASAQSLRGKVWVADFFFTNCPGPCPRMSSQMHDVQTKLDGADRFALV